MNRVAVHGLELESELTLAGWPADSSASVDVRIARLSREPSVDSAAVAARSAPPAYSVHRSNSGFVVEIPGVARLAVTANDVAVFPVSCVPGQLESLVEGMALSLVVDARGELPLHASAVSLDGRTVAIVGGTGAGKSTLAGLLTAGGARFVSDDVLRVVHLPDGCFCYPGTARLRLRSRVRAIAGLLPQWQTRETHDGRLALAPPSLPPGRRPLDGIVLPEFTAAAREPEFHRLRGIDALKALLAAPRIPTWTDLEVQARYHRHIAALARVVPVYAARLPRLPFDRTSATALFEVFSAQCA